MIRFLNLEKFILKSSVHKIIPFLILHFSFRSGDTYCMHAKILIY